MRSASGTGTKMSLSFLPLPTHDPSVNWTNILSQSTMTFTTGPGRSSGVGVVNLGVLAKEICLEIHTHSPAEERAQLCFDLAHVMKRITGLCQMHLPSTL